MSSDDEMAKQAMRIREMERKATFESTQSEMRRNKDLLQTLRRENKELRGALNQSVKGSTVNSGAFQRKETELLQTRLHALRRQLDDSKAANDEKAADIAKMSEQTEDMEKEAEPILHEGDPMTQKIRTLENRLDKSLIKHNEAMSIRRTYETILKRLRDERVGFDNQLAAIEKTLKAKEHDYMELLNMAHDAMHAKEIAKAELHQFKKSFEIESAQKKKELEERKAYVQARLDQTLKQEKAAKAKKQQQEEKQMSKQDDDEKRKRDLMQSTVALRTEEEQERLQQYAEAYRRIKEVTRANDVDEVIAKFILQEDTHRDLSEISFAAEARIDALRTQRDELRRKVDDAKFSGSGQLGSRRIVDEFETHLAEARAQLEKAQKEYEATSRQYNAVKAGVEHLSLKLSGEAKDDPAAGGAEEDIVEILQQIDSKLRALSDVDATPETLDEYYKVHQRVAKPHDPSNPNVRVRVAGEGDDEDEERQRGDTKGEVDDAEDDPHDRVALKQMSLSAVERETKKARKRGRKKEEEAA